MGGLISDSRGAGRTFSREKVSRGERGKKGATRSWRVTDRIAVSQEGGRDWEGPKDFGMLNRAKGGGAPSEVARLEKHGRASPKGGLEGKANAPRPGPYRRRGSWDVSQMEILSWQRRWMRDAKKARRHSDSPIGG